MVAIKYAVLRDAVRVAVGVFLLAMLGFHVYAARFQMWFADEVEESLLWGAITVVLVATPVIGKTVRTGIERILGTLLGGLLAYAVAQADSPLLYSVAAGAVALTAVAAGNTVNLEYSGKLFAITYIIVAGAAHTGAHPLVSAISRVLGIIGGVLVAFLLSCTVFPHSASERCLDNLQQALQLLEQLSDKAWQGLQHNELSDQAAGEQQQRAKQQSHWLNSRGSSSRLLSSSSEDVARAAEQHHHHHQQPAAPSAAMQRAASKIRAWLHSGSSQELPAGAAAQEPQQAPPSGPGSGRNQQRAAALPAAAAAAAANNNNNTDAGVKARQPGVASAWRSSGAAEAQPLQDSAAISILPAGLAGLHDEGRSDSAAAVVDAQHAVQVPEAPCSEAEREVLQAKDDQEFEDAIYAVHRACSSFEENAKHARGELYSGRLLSHRCFLPLLFPSTRNSSHLPLRQLQDLHTCVRRLARLVWTLHLTIQRGFSEEMVAVLQRRYPAQLLERLRSSCAAAMCSAVAAFPGSGIHAALMSEAHLRSFGAAVAQLLEISEQQRHQIVEHVHNYGGAAPAAGASCCGSIAAERSSCSDELLLGGRSALQAQPLGPAAAAAAPLQALHAGQAGPCLAPAAGEQVASGSQQWDQDKHQHNMRRDQHPQQPLLRQAGGPQRPGEALGSRVQLDPLQAGDSHTAWRSTSASGSLPRGSPQQAGPPQRLRAIATTSLPTPFAQPTGAQPPAELFSHGPGAAAVAGTHAQREEAQQQRPDLAAGQSLGSTAAAAGGMAERHTASSPDCVPTSRKQHSGAPRRRGSRQVPLFFGRVNSLRQQQQQQQQQQLAAPADGTVCAKADVSARPPQRLPNRELAALQRLDTPRLLFPDTPDGHMAKVRWNSFQWLMEQLGQELDELRRTLNAAVAQLPGVVLTA